MIDATARGADTPWRFEPLRSVDNSAVVIEAVKLAEDRSGDVIVRFYEAHGSRARATVIRHFEATSSGYVLVAEIARSRWYPGA